MSQLASPGADGDKPTVDSAQSPFVIAATIHEQPLPGDSKPPEIKLKGWVGWGGSVNGIVQTYNVQKALKSQF